MALVKLFASSKEEISRFCTKLSITPDRTFDLRKRITAVTESYYDLAEMQRLGKSKREEKLSVAKSDERLVSANVDDESRKFMLNGLTQKPTAHSMTCKCYQIFTVCTS